MSVHIHRSGRGPVEPRRCAILHCPHRPSRRSGLLCDGHRNAPAQPAPDEPKEQDR